MLGEQRRDLLAQLDAVDKAITALDGAGRTATETPPGEPGTPVTRPESAVLPRRVAPRRVLSDSHKQAVVVGKRRARGAKDAAQGLAREMLGDAFVPAIGTRGERQTPRLVKRPIQK